MFAWTLASSESRVLDVLGIMSPVAISTRTFTSGGMLVWIDRTQALDVSSQTYSLSSRFNRSRDPAYETAFASKSERDRLCQNADPASITGCTSIWNSVEGFGLIGMSG